MKTPANPVINYAPAPAQTASADYPVNVGIRQLAWMAGSWSGTVDGELVDAHWSSPAGGMMIGMFRWLKNERV